MFATLTNERKIRNNFILMSLDVVSLLSNIPCHLVTKSIEKLTKSPKNEFLKLTKFILEVYLLFFSKRIVQTNSGYPYGGLPFAHYHSICG